MTLEELKGSGGESSQAVAEPVQAARRLQRPRFADSVAITTNAALVDSELRHHCLLEGPAQTLLDSAFERLALSARATTRILKVARTIADLRGAERIGAADVAEAIQFRSLDRRC